MLPEKRMFSTFKNFKIAPVFQPVVSLTSGELLGYEAFLRGYSGNQIIPPLDLIKDMQRKQCHFELDYLFKAITFDCVKDSNFNPNQHFLFLNVDPLILHHLDYGEKVTKLLLKDYGLHPDHLILELTEHSTINDYCETRRAIEFYRELGYRFAIDNVGSGYSSFKLILETEPDYLKIDMSFIHNVDQEPMKQAIIKSFITLSNHSSIQLIAKGIETANELQTLIHMGLRLGQGKYIRKPCFEIPENHSFLKSEILMYQEESKNIFNLQSHQLFIGNIAEQVDTIQPDLSCYKTKEIIENKDIEGICVTFDNRPVGLMMRNQLNEVLSRQFGVALYTKRPITELMDQTPLIVDYYTPVGEVSTRAMLREVKNVYDHIVVVKGAQYYGLVSVKSLLQYTTDFEKNYAQSLNPLSGLPGNKIISRVLDSALTSQGNQALIYLDLNNFKVYNDIYGFDHGDKVLKLTAEIMRKVVSQMVPVNSFVGHIGGDDFMIYLHCSYEMCSSICQSILEEFDLQIQKCFNETDLKNAFLICEDRHGNHRKFGLTSISISGFHGKLHRFNDIEDLTMTISALKKETKKAGKSHFILRQI